MQFPYFQGIDRNWNGVALHLRPDFVMKMLSDYQGIDLGKVGYKPELKRLHTAAESLVLAMRYVGIQERDEEKLETILRKIAFLDEIREEIKEATKSGRSIADQLPQWAFELSLVSEDGELDQIHDFLDSLFRCFAEACVWLSQIVADDSDKYRTAELDATFRKLTDFVGCGSLAIISGSNSDLGRRVA